ncbi:hypothetical protein Tco_0776359 [Tanacetum coccineum]
MSSSQTPPIITPCSLCTDSLHFHDSTPTAPGSSHPAMSKTAPPIPTTPPTQIALQTFVMPLASSQTTPNPLSSVRSSGHPIVTRYRSGIFKHKHDADLS